MSLPEISVVGTSSEALRPDGVKSLSGISDAHNWYSVDSHNGDSINLPESAQPAAVQTSEDGEEKIRSSNSDHSYHSYGSDHSINTPGESDSDNEESYVGQENWVIDRQDGEMSSDLRDSQLYTSHDLADDVVLSISEGNRSWTDSGPVDSPMDLKIAQDAIKGGDLSFVDLRVGQQMANTDVTDGGDLEYEAGQHARSQRSIESMEAVTTESLQTQLLAAHCRVQGNDRTFLPIDVMASIITQKCVHEVLGRSVPHSKKVIKDYARQVCERTVIETPDELTPGQPMKRRVKCFRKIFIILVMLSKTSDIVKFIECGVNDSDLPLKKNYRYDENSNQKNLFDFCRRHGPKTPLECFDNWSDIELYHFALWQWTTLSPFFTTGQWPKAVNHYHLHHDIILPYTSIDKKHVLSGGSAQVFKVQIHNKHHDFPDHQGNYFALKRLRLFSRASFKKEVDMLKKFSHYQHEHLISLLVTYEQNDVFYLVFPWAEANLEKYWFNTVPQPCPDKKTVGWVAKQCRGIASGILKLHEYRTFIKDGSQELTTVIGHHGDIKPENVLWFPEDDQKLGIQGTLKLSDFGLAEFKKHRTESRTTKRSRFCGSLAYRAPEIELEGPGAIGRQYDIWTLGCLYLQFIIWLLGGAASLREFSKIREAGSSKSSKKVHDNAFFQLDGDHVDSGRKTASVKPGVTQFIKKLRSNTSCSQFLHEFLDMISEDMLVVKNNDPRVKYRIDAEQLNAKFTSMMDKIQNTEGYA